LIGKSRRVLVLSSRVIHHADFLFPSTTFSVGYTFVLFQVESSRIGSHQSSLKELRDIHLSIDGTLGGSHAKFEVIRIENVIPQYIVVGRIAVHNQLMEKRQRGSPDHVLAENRRTIGLQQASFFGHLLGFAAGHFIQDGTACQGLQSKACSLVIDHDMIAHIGTLWRRQRSLKGWSWVVFMTAAVAITIEEVHAIGRTTKGSFLSTTTRRRSSRSSNPKERQEGRFFILCSGIATVYGGSGFFLFSSCRAWTFSILLLLVFGMTITGTLLGTNHSMCSGVLDSCSSVGHAVHVGNGHVRIERLWAVCACRFQ